MRILIVVPGTPETLTGNWRTAERWQRIFGGLGHEARLERELDEEPADVLVPLHALRSHEAIASSRLRHPGRKIILALTGTDLYRDVRVDPRARRSLELADRLVVLQRLADEEIPAELRARVCVIYQSAEPWPLRRDAQDPHYRILVVANLRPVKDALRPARAARLLPRDSRILVTLIGSATSPQQADEVRREAGENARFRWLGFLPHDATRDEIARSHLVVIPSLIEGSSNVLSETLATGVPVLATSIVGLRGTLGDDYEGYFSTGDERGLAERMFRAESDPAFLARLQGQCEKLRALVQPAAESAAWRDLLCQVYPQ